MAPAADPHRPARIVTLNLWGDQGPDWRARHELVAERLAALRPDVVCLQEVRDVPGRVPNQARRLADALGMAGCAYAAAETWGGGEEGVAILSRAPLAGEAVAELPTAEGRSRRVCLGGHLDLPAGRAWVFSTHLAYRLDDGLLRERQVVAVDAFVRRQVAGGAAAPVLAGDFNATPDADEIRFLKGLTTVAGRRAFYQDAFEARNPGVAGHTWAAENPYTEALAWLGPGRRLDYLFVGRRRRAGAGRIRACRIVCQEPDARGVRCSDHYGLLAEVDLFDRPER